MMKKGTHALGRNDTLQLLHNLLVNRAMQVHNSFRFSFADLEHLANRGRVAPVLLARGIMFLVKLVLAFIVSLNQNFQ